MLQEIKTDKGSYLKYIPTIEEVIDLFETWQRTSYIRPSDVPSILKMNLEKWGKIEWYSEISKKIKEDN